MTDAAVSVRAVADLLAQHPEALIRGRVLRRAEQFHAHPFHRLGRLPPPGRCLSPDPRYFAPERVAGPPLRSPAQTVVVRSTVVSHYLERDEIVVKTENGRVRLASNDWWSQPLRQELQQAFAADLTQRLPDMTVLGTEALGGEGADVVLAVERFEPNGTGATMIAGYAAVDFTGSNRVLRRNSTRVPSRGSRVADQVAAMRQALAALRNRPFGGL